MDFKQFAKRMIVILEKRKIRTNAFYQCVLCETVSQSEINPIYTSNWSWLKDDDYLCHHCSYHVSLLASLQQQV